MDARELHLIRKVGVLSSLGKGTCNPDCKQRMTLEGDRRNESSATSPRESRREGKGQLASMSSSRVPREPPLRHLMKEVSGRRERGAYPRSRVTGAQQLPGDAKLPSSVRTLNSTFLIYLFGGGEVTWLFCFIFLLKTSFSAHE